MLVFSVAFFSSGAHASGTLTISGTPASTANVGSAYSFTPTVKVEQTRAFGAEVASGRTVDRVLL